MLTASPLILRLRRSKPFEWFKLIALTGSAQVAVQALGFICGILIIRLLPTSEYALYTLANTMLGTMTLLADGGIANGVMAQGGKVWRDKAKLGSVLATGLILRKKFAIVSLVLVVPALLYLLNHHGASWPTAAMIIAALLPIFWASLSGSLLEIVPKLHQDIPALQRIQVSSNLLRLVAVAGSVAALPFASVALLGGGLARFYANFRLRRSTAHRIDLASAQDPKTRSEILNVVKRVMPGAVYYSLSGHITIWLISIWGTTEAVAQLGALGRLAIALTFVSTLFGTLVVPRFARLPDHKPALLVRFVQIQGGVILVGLSLLGFIWQFPSLTLNILGSRYEGLQTEVVLMAANAALANAAGIAYSCNASRGIIQPPWIIIPLAIVAQIMLIAWIQPSSVIDAYIFSLIFQCILYTSHVAYFLRSMRK